MCTKGYDRDIAGGPLSRGERNRVSAHVDRVPRAPRREADIGAGWSRGVGGGPGMTPSGWIMAVFSVNYEMWLPMGSEDTESKVCTRKKRLERVTWENGKMNKAGKS